MKKKWATPRYRRRIQFVPFESLRLEGAVAFLLALIIAILPAGALAASVALTWESTNEPGLAGFRIYYGTSSGQYTSVVDIAGANATTYTVQDLANGVRYYLAATAYDTLGNESGYSNEVVFPRESLPETVTAPLTPAGPASPITGQSCTFTTGGATSSDGHPVQYRFLWTDGSSSAWLPAGTTSIVKSWSTVGAQTVRAEARCASDTSILSAASAALSVTVTAPPAAETVNAPSLPGGPTSVTAGLGGVFTAGGATSTYGDAIQYRFSWGDGTTSGWLAPGTTTASKTWSNAGTYAVSATARCATHTSIVSAASAALSVAVNVSAPPPPPPPPPDEAVTPPFAPRGPSVALAGQEYLFTTGGARSSGGHPVQYRFTWSDGTSSGWLPPGTTTAVVSWNYPGTYTDVRAEARCADHPGIVSKPSSPHHVTVAQPARESMARPLAPTGHSTGGIRIPYSYTADGASSSLGHRVEYWFHWGDGTRSRGVSPSASLPPQAAKAWRLPGTYSVVVEARCSRHPSVSAFSAPLLVEISADAVLFSDDFADGGAQGDPDWEALSGTWRVGRDKTLASSSKAAGNRIVARSLPAFFTGRLETRFRLTPSRTRTPNAGLLFAHQDGDHYRYVSVLGSSIVIGQVGDTPLETAGRKASVRRRTVAGRWNRVAVDVRPDGEVRVYLGAALKPAVTYRFADLPAGGAGYLSSRVPASYDDFAAWDESVLP